MDHRHLREPLPGSVATSQLLEELNWIPRPKLLGAAATRHRDGGRFAYAFSASA